HEEHEEHEDHDEHDEDAENTRGYVANTGGKTESFTLGSSWIFDNGFLGLAVNRLDNRYGLPPGAHDHGHDHGDDDHSHDEEDHDHEEDAVPGADFVHIDMQRTRYDL